MLTTHALLIFAAVYAAAVATPGPGIVALVARALGGAVILKGHRSEIADAGGAAYTNGSGNSGMACAGMGDVLSGVCGTLLAQDLSPFDAGRLGAHWHGLAGDLAAEAIGALGFTPSEVASRLPSAREVLLAGRG